ncbi:pseudouridine synthase, partial [Pelagophyceae sp. CCMP2097]
TVQGELEKVLRSRFGPSREGRMIQTLGASRTDTGVHAQGQRATAPLPVDVAGASARVRGDVNRMLPDDIRVRNLLPAPSVSVEVDSARHEWHAIASSVGKKYVYEPRRRCRRQTREPIHRFHRGDLGHRPLDADLFRAALREFEGRHDFRAFANQVPRARPNLILNKSTSREIFSTNYVVLDDGYVNVEVELDGALYKMVRNVIGTAAAVAAGTMDLKAIPRLFQVPDPQWLRNQAKAAPACGLHLERVHYKDFDI